MPKADPAETIRRVTQVALDVAQHKIPGCHAQRVAIDKIFSLLRQAGVARVRVEISPRSVNVDPNPSPHHDQK